MSKSTGEVAASGLRAGTVLAVIGRATLLGLSLTRSLVRPGDWLRATITELHRQSFDALGLTIVLTVAGGALIAQQTGYQFQGTLPSWVVGAIVAASVITEITPLFVGLTFVGVVGTRIAAELAAMQATEQVDALEVIGRDPVVYLVAPRVLASCFAGPLLIAVGLGASIVAGWGVALITTRAGTADFWFGVRHYMRDFPMFYALIKGAAFSTAITFIACYAGLHSSGGSAGVGRTVRQAVVAMISAVIVLDTALVPLLKVVRV